MLARTWHCLSIDTNERDLLGWSRGMGFAKKRMENPGYLTFSPHQASVAGILPTFFGHYKIIKRCQRKADVSFTNIVQNKIFGTVHQNIAFFTVECNSKYDFSKTKNIIFHSKKIYQYNIVYIP